MLSLSQIAAVLGLAVVLVPLGKRLGLGSVLGYLAAGVLLGDHVFGVVHEAATILHFSEFGVVLLLFVIGLELKPSRLWVMRKLVFGLGGAQVLLSGAALCGAGLLFGLEPGPALVAGFGLALSSTAFVLPILAEKGQLTSAHGRASFGVLLFQDLAIIPILAALPLLATAQAVADADESGLLSALKIIAVFGGLLLAGRLLLRPALRFVASTHNHEIFTAAALFVVVGTAALMHAIGVSMSLGAFLAGVLLADSEYRHEIQADIEPFKGLFLGLFFVAVGMSTDVGVLTASPLAVLGAALGFMLLKAAVIYGLGRAFGHRAASRPLALALCQGGEFAFVLFGAAAAMGVMPQAEADFLVVAVTVSMILTPFAFMLEEKLLSKLGKAAAAQRPFDAIEEPGKPVIIAGFGRFGQMVARVLVSRRIGFTALEASPAQVDFVRRFGNRIHYGDASRLELLRAAEAEKARVFVLAIDDVEASVRTAELVRRHFPSLAIYARARNRQHAMALMNLGVKLIMRETLLSSLELAEQVLVGLGLESSAARHTVERFREVDEEILRRQHAVQDDEAQLIQTAKEAAEELERLFEDQVT